MNGTATQSAGGERRWQGTTNGSASMHHALTAILRAVNIRLVYAFSALFVVPVCLFRPGAGHIFRYLRRRAGMSFCRALWGTYRNHCLFGQVVIDRFAMYAGKKFTVKIEGYEHFLRLARRPEGFVQLSAHVGNYELGGYSLVAADKPMNALVFGGEKESVMHERSRMFGHSRIRMIPVTDRSSHLFRLNDALASGEIVSMPADRSMGSLKTVEADFMGGKAQFPAGPFRTAVMRGCDTLAVNVMKSGATEYTIYVTPLDYDRTLGRDRQTAQLAAAYAAELERVLRKYPLQWYNFFEFWNE